MLLSNKVAIVTGAAGGIGRGIALKFASEGCDVIIGDLNLPGAEETLAEVKKHGVDGFALQVDVTKNNQVLGMVDKVIAKYGRIDVLVNNAGTLFDVADITKRSIAQIPEDEWDRLVEINLKGCFLCIKAVAPHMMEKKYGKIVNFSTLGAIWPPAVAPHYNAAKAGVIGLTYDVAAELGPYGITVNVILPGPIRSTFYKNIMGHMTKEEQEARYAGMCALAPLQRCGTPEDIAGAALFLASDLSSYVTAVQLLVSGGMPVTARL